MIRADEGSAVSRSQFLDRFCSKPRRLLATEQRLLSGANLVIRESAFKGIQSSSRASETTQSLSEWCSQLEESKLIQSSADSENYCKFGAGGLHPCHAPFPSGLDFFRVITLEQLMHTFSKKFLRLMCFLRIEMKRLITSQLIQIQWFFKRRIIRSQLAVNLSKCFHLSAELCLLHQHNSSSVSQDVLEFEHHSNPKMLQIQQVVQIDAGFGSSFRHPPCALPHLQLIRRRIQNRGNHLALR